MDNVCIAPFFIRNEVTALGRVVSFEACCQWTLHSVKITRLVTLPTLKCTIQEYIYPSVSKVSACWIVSCFRNPPNSDMDHRIFNACTWSFLYVRIHTGVGHTDSESAQQFWLGKTIVFLTELGCEPRVMDGIHWILRPTLYQLSHPSPQG